MSIYYANGGKDLVLSSEDMKSALCGVLDELGPREHVLAIPPDITRLNSRAGELTCMTHDYFGDQLTDILPALGQHVPMTDEQLDRMFPGIPHSLFRPHDWRNDVVTIGTLPADYVKETTEGTYNQEWPVQLNKLVWEGGHDLILSIGQIVPHEVIGMANYTKNLLVGTGGSECINHSHFMGALYGLERMMGRINTPIRKILNHAADTFFSHLPILYVLTVVGPTDDGEWVTRGLYIGDDEECFTLAGRLSQEVNITILDEEPEHVVVYLDPEEFHSLWLGNKSIYRTRMAIADGGTLTVLAPGMKTFGEDSEIDRLIRKYGYRTTPEMLKFFEENEDLQNNRSAVSHIIVSSGENRFNIEYCTGHLTREEIEGVGYQFGDLDEMITRYDPDKLTDGWNTLPDGERIYYVSNPALGLWAHQSRFQRD